MTIYLGCSARTRAACSLLVSGQRVRVPRLCLALACAYSLLVLGGCCIPDATLKQGMQEQLPQPLSAQDPVSMSILDTMRLVSREKRRVSL